MLQLIFCAQVLLLCLHSSSSSSSSCHATSTYIPGPLPPHLSFVPCFWKVLRATSRILTELLYVGSSWSPCFCPNMWRCPLETITYELVPASPAVSCMSGSSNFGGFRDGWPYSWCFVGCYLQDLFNIARSNLCSCCLSSSPSVYLVSM